MRAALLFCLWQCSMASGDASAPTIARTIDEAAYAVYAIALAARVGTDPSAGRAIPVRKPVAVYLPSKGWSGTGVDGRPDTIQQFGLDRLDEETYRGYRAAQPGTLRARSLGIIPVRLLDGPPPRGGPVDVWFSVTPVGFNAGKSRALVVVHRTERGAGDGVAYLLEKRDGKWSILARNTVYSWIA
jgi:hypothetical protein